MSFGFSGLLDVGCQETSMHDSLHLLLRLWGLTLSWPGRIQPRSHLWNGKSRPSLGQKWKYLHHKWKCTLAFVTPWPTLSDERTSSKSGFQKIRLCSEVIISSVAPKKAIFFLPLPHRTVWTTALCGLVRSPRLIPHLHHKDWGACPSFLGALWEHKAATKIGRDFRLLLVGHLLRSLTFHNTFFPLALSFRIHWNVTVLVSLLVDSWDKLARLC